MKSKMDTIRVTIESDTRKEVEKILSCLGSSSTDVIRMLFAQITLTKSIPFEIKLPAEIPNAETIEAIEQVRRREGLTTVSTIDELKRELKV